MKRAVLRQVKDLVLEDVERPACPADGLLLKVAACAVCATDVRMYNYGHDLLQLPRVLGHEVAGVVEEVGAELGERFHPGDRVAVCAVVNCCECTPCRQAVPSMCQNLRAFGYHFDGGYQEYMVVPQAAIRCGGVNILAPTLSFEDAALVELLACCINGQRLSDVRLGQSMLILGAGPVGILHALLAHAQGASAVYLADVAPERLALAQQVCGSALTGTLSSSDNDALVRATKELTSGAGFDQVMVACSAAAAQQVSLELVAKSGCVNLFGGLPKGRSQVTLDTNHIHYKQCRVVGTHGSSAEDNRLALGLVASGAVNIHALITDRISLDQLEKYLQPDNSAANRLKTVVLFP